MRQHRVNVGKDFENSLEKDGWIVKQIKPRLSWIANGSNKIQKIKNSIKTPQYFILNEKKSSFIKYDVIHNDTNELCEVKHYTIKNLKNWLLYSEPYFKIARNEDAGKIDKETYNKFVENFYEYNLSTDLFETVQKKMTQNVKGVIIIDNFIPMNDFEFRTVLLKNCWKGYHRITIQLKLKL